MPTSTYQYPSSVAFLLEEGDEIRQDPMDYELCLLHKTCSEKLHSPLPPHALGLRDVPVFHRLQLEIRKNKLPF